MSDSLERYELQHQANDEVDRHVADVDLEESEERAVMEKKLVRKLDRRMCILVFIYILNYVRFPFHSSGTFVRIADSFPQIVRNNVS